MHSLEGVGVAGAWPPKRAPSESKPHRVGSFVKSEATLGRLRELIGGLEEIVASEIVFCQSPNCGGSG